MNKRSPDKHPLEMVVHDPDAGALAQRYAQQIRIQSSGTSSLTEEILTHTSGTRNPHTGIFHKSCTSGPTTASWRKDPDKETLDKRSADRDLPQEALEAADAEILKHILPKWYYRILMRRS